MAYTTSSVTLTTDLEFTSLSTSLSLIYFPPAWTSSSTITSVKTSVFTISTTITTASVRNLGPTLNRTSNVTTPSFSPTQSPISNHLSKKAEIGIGVGSAIGGAILIFLAICLFLRRSKKRPSESPLTKAENGNETHGSGPRDKVDMSVSVRPASTANPFTEILEERADDSQIRKSMQDFNELIHQHVENHYHLKQLPDRPGDLEQAVLRCGFMNQSNPSAKAMVPLLTNPKTRRMAIRRLIASVIIGGIELKSDAETSLLAGQIQRAKRQPGEEQAISRSLTTRRHHSASILDSPSAKQQEPQLRAAIAQNVSRLNSVLKSSIRQDTESLRRQKDNLSSIILEGANLGSLLLSQPVDWVFGWDTSKTAQRQAAYTLVVFPSVGEVKERGGRATVRMIVEAVDEYI